MHIKINKPEYIADFRDKIKTCFITGTIEQAVAAAFRDSFLTCLNNEQPFIPVMISSEGGEVGAGIEIVNLIRSSDKPVITVINGYAMSMAVPIAAVGTHRFITPNSMVMIHQVWSMAGGNPKDIKIVADRTEMLNDFVYNILAERAGKPSNYFRDLTKQNDFADLYLKPQEVLMHGLVHEIGFPKIKMTVETRWDIV